MQDGKSLINLPRLLFSKFQLISHIHFSLKSVVGSDEYTPEVKLMNKNISK